MRKSLILLGILDDSDVQWMLRAGLPKRVIAGDVLVQQRKPLDFLHVVLAGQLSVTTSGGHQIAPLLAGDIVGEMSFVDSRPPSANVIAAEESRILSIHKQDVRERLDDDLAFAARFYRAIAVFLSLRMRETSAQLGYGQVRLADEEQDDQELPEDILMSLSIAATRFNMLQERGIAAG